MIWEGVIHAWVASGVVDFTFIYTDMGVPYIERILFRYGTLDRIVYFFKVFVEPCWKRRFITIDVLQLCVVRSRSREAVTWYPPRWMMASFLFVCVVVY